jgi:hypothetical protein
MHYSGTLRIGALRAVAGRRMETGPKPPLELGLFVNHFAVANSREEFLIEMGQMLPGEPEVRVSVRLITTPPYANALWQVLGESLNRYQNVFSSIPPIES